MRALAYTQGVQQRMLTGCCVQWHLALRGQSFACWTGSMVGCVAGQECGCFFFLFEIQWHENYVHLFGFGVYRVRRNPLRQDERPCWSLSHAT